MNNKFAERLKDLRIEKGLSQIGLSKETGISSSAIAFWELEKRIPNLVDVVTLIRFFGVSADYMLGLED